MGWCTPSTNHLLSGGPSSKEAWTPLTLSPKGSRQEVIIANDLDVVFFEWITIATGCGFNGLVRSNTNWKMIVIQLYSRKETQVGTCDWKSWHFFVLFWECILFQWDETPLGNPRAGKLFFWGGGGSLFIVNASFRWKCWKGVSICFHAFVAFRITTISDSSEQK